MIWLLRVCVCVSRHSVIELIWCAVRSLLTAFRRSWNETLPQRQQWRRWGKLLRVNTAAPQTGGNVLFSPRWPLKKDWWAALWITTHKIRPNLGGEKIICIRGNCVKFIRKVSTRPLEITQESHQGPLITTVKMSHDIKGPILYTFTGCCFSSLTPVELHMSPHTVNYQRFWG